MRVITVLVLLLGMSWVGVEAASADDAPPRLSAVAVTGDASPLGGAFSSFGRSALLSADRVAFTATTEGIFADRGSGPEAVVISGDPAPDGGTFSSVGPPAVDAAGNVYFVANVDGGAAAIAIFRRSESATTTLVRTGDVLPTGIRITRINRRIAVNGAGSLVFVAGTSRWDEAVYVVSGGSVSGPLLSVDDATPCGRIVRLGRGRRPFQITDAGDVAVAILAASSQDGILRLPRFGMPSVADAICEDASSPDGGTYRSLTDFAFGEPPDSPIVFRASTTVGSARLFRSDLSGAVSVVAAPGSLTTDGESISSIPSASIVVDATGAIAYTARIGGRTAVLAHGAGQPAPALLVDVGAGCLSGETVTSIGADLAGNELGRLLISARCSSSAGVFTVGGPSGPTVVVTDATSTPIGPGLIYGSATARSGMAAMRGFRTAVYQRDCPGGRCGAVEVLAAQHDPIPGVSGERLWDIDAASLTGARAEAAFTAGTLGGREVVLASRRGRLRSVAITGAPLAGTTLTPTALRQGGVATDGERVAFVATGLDAADGLTHTAAVATRGSGFEEVARVGDPVTVGDAAAEYTLLTAPLVTGRSVALLAWTSIGNCWIERRGKRVRPLVCDGFPLPGSLTDQSSILGDSVGALSSRGLAVPISGNAFLPSCLVITRRNGMRPIACTGDRLPDGIAVQSFDGPSVAAAGARTVASVTGDGASGLYAFRDRTATLLARDDDPSPFGGGGRIDVTSARPSIAGKVVSFDGTVAGGAHAGFIALATLPR